jgi:hypothetical protein
MALIDRFRRRATRNEADRDDSAHGHTLRDHATIGSFIDDRSFELAASCVRDYARLRAGAGDADAVLAEAPLAAAIDKASWEGYPRALTMVGTIVEGVLRPYAGDNAHAMQFGLVAMVLENFDRRSVPQAIGGDNWQAARADTERSLNDCARIEPRSVDTIVKDQSSFFLAIMPLHPKLGADDFTALRGRLKLALMQFREAFVQRADLPALTAELVARMPKVESNDAPSAPS